MKKLNYLFLTAAAAVLITLSTQAGDASLTPRAADLQIHKVRGSAVNDPNLVANRPDGNAKAWTLARSVQVVPSTGYEVDLAHAPRPSFAPRDPRYEVALRKNAVSEFQIAPLK